MFLSASTKPEPFASRFSYYTTSNYNYPRTNFSFNLSYPYTGNILINPILFLQRETVLYIKKEKQSLYSKINLYPKTHNTILHPLIFTNIT